LDLKDQRQDLKISVITAVYNSKNTIEDCLKSISSQTYHNIEHIIVDGGSTDETLDIIKKYSGRIAYWISESDNGIYDAMRSLSSFYLYPPHCFFPLLCAILHLWLLSFY